MDSSDKLPRHLVIGFILALVIYVSFFAGDQRMRQRKGGWDVTFSTNSSGFPAIIINQPALSITNVQVIFQSETPTNAPGHIVFNKPQQPIPFGKVKFEDLTYLPGSVAFDFFGHEVELLPRTLYLNKVEHPWKSDAVFTLQPNQKLPPEASIDPRVKKKRSFGR